MGRRGHVDADVDDARASVDKAGAVAVDGAVPVGVDRRVGVIGKEVVGIGDGEAELGTVESIMLEPPAQFGRMSLAVVDGNVAELDIVRDDVNGDVGCRVIAIHIVDQEAYGIGHDIALEVDGVEIAEQDRLSRHLALDIAGERLHVGLEEGHIGVIGVKLDVK